MKILDEYRGMREGTRANRLVLIGPPFVFRAGVTKIRNRIACVCRCDCGTVVSVLAEDFLGGSSSSCGCWKRDLAIARVHPKGADSKGFVHGDHGSRLYRTWNNMKQRCENPKNRKFAIYGGKGVQVCEAWKSFAGFREWAIASGYRDDLTIDRINTAGNYEPSNCQWLTLAENSRRGGRARWAGRKRAIA